MTALYLSIPQSGADGQAIFLHCITLSCEAEYHNISFREKVKSGFHISVFTKLIFRVSAPLLAKLN